VLADGIWQQQVPVACEVLLMMYCGTLLYGCILRYCLPAGGRAEGEAGWMLQRSG
jgi:hypothetical protein